MIANGIELELQLKEAGNRLQDPLLSTDELLDMLDNLECVLINVDQAPSRSMQDALLPSMKALISDALLRNSDADVKVSVASCLSEITRITAPDPPYNDDHMREIFQLIVAAFEKLSHMSSRCYMKAVSILDTVAKVRSCLIMLDLDLDELIVKMFQHFLKIIRSNHPHDVFMAMETIMTLIIDESDDISVGLLTPLLASVRKENQSASTIAWKLGEKVFVNSASKLKSYLKKAVHLEGRAFDEYSPIVASICQDESCTVVCDHVNGSRDYLVTLSPDAASPGEDLHGVNGIPESTTTNGNASIVNADNGTNENVTKELKCCSLVQHSESTVAHANADSEVKLEMDQGTVPTKRGRKPNSLMNPEEGYDNCWIHVGRKCAKVPRERKLPDKEVDLHLENRVPKKSNMHVTAPGELMPETGGIVDASTPSPDQSLPDGIHRKRGRPKKNVSNWNQDPDLSSLCLAKVLNTENVEKAAEHKVSLSKQSDGRSTTKIKQRKCSRNTGLAVKTAQETSLPSACLLSGEKDGFLSEPEEEPLHQSAQIGAKIIKKDSSIIQIDTGRRSLVISISSVGVGEAFRIKKNKHADRDGNNKEEMPRNNIKRKRTPRKEVPPETPELDERLTGSRIKVWWPKDRMFYEGVVDSYYPIKKKHKILYADGDEEILDLRRERWELIGDDSLPNEVEQVTNIPKVDSSSHNPQQGKGKVKLELAKQLKIDLERSGATNISKRKAKIFGSKSASGNAQDELGFVKKAINDTSRPGSISEDGKNSTKEFKMKSTVIGIKTEQIKLENASPSNDGNTSINESLRHCPT